MKMSGSRRLIKLTVFSLTPVVLLVAFLEVAIRVYVYQRHSIYSSGILQAYAAASNWVSRVRNTDDTTVITAEPVFQLDPVTGYRGVPGIHAISFLRAGHASPFQVVIGEDGYRTTSKNPASNFMKPGLWIFGCSFTYGYGLNNEDTFPWLLQAALPGWAVRNLGMPGFGNVQALLQLEHAIHNNEVLPRLAVFVYNPFDLDRNIGAPSYLASVRAARAQLKRSEDFYHRRYARAFINEQGNFVVDYVDLDSGAERRAGKPLNDGELAWSHKPEEDSQGLFVTKVIFHRIWTLAAQHGIVPILAMQSGTPRDPVVRYALSIGFRFVDISVDLSADYTLLPFDGHPNKQANLKYEELLLTGIAPLLK